MSTTITKNELWKLIKEEPEVMANFLALVKASAHYERKVSIINSYSDPARIFEAKEGLEYSLRVFRLRMGDFSTIVRRKTGKLVFSSWGKGNDFNKEIMLAEYDKLCPTLYKRMHDPYWL